MEPYKETATAAIKKGQLFRFCGALASCQEGKCVRRTTNPGSRGRATAAELEGVLRLEIASNLSQFLSHFPHILTGRVFSTSSRARSDLNNNL